MVFAEHGHASRIFRGRPLHEIESAYKDFEPIWKAVGEFQFKYHERRIDDPRAGELDGSIILEIGLDTDIPVKSDPDRIVMRADPSLAQVGVM